MGKIKDAGDFVMRLRDEMVRSITGLSPNFHTNAGEIVGDDYHLGVILSDLNTGKNLNEVVLIISARITAGGRLVAGVKAELGYVLYECDCDNPARIYGECGRIADDIAERFDWTKVNLKSEDVPRDKRVKLDAGLAGIIKRLDNAAYVATEDDPSQTSVDVFNDVLAELLLAVGVKPSVALDADLIAESIREKMNWVGLGAEVVVPADFGNANLRQDRRRLTVKLVDYDNGNLEVAFCYGADLHFVNRDVANSFGNGLTADLLLRDLHAYFGEEFWLCMKLEDAK